MKLIFETKMKNLAKFLFQKRFKCCNYIHLFHNSVILLILKWFLPQLPGFCYHKLRQFLIQVDVTVYCIGVSSN